MTITKEQLLNLNKETEVEIESLGGSVKITQLKAGDYDTVKNILYNGVSMKSMGNDKMQMDGTSIMKNVGKASHVLISKCLFEPDLSLNEIRDLFTQKNIQELCDVMLENSGLGNDDTLGMLTSKESKEKNKEETTEEAVKNFRE